MWDEKGYLLRNYIRVENLVEYPALDKEIGKIDQFMISQPRETSTRVLDIKWIRGRFNIQTKEMADQRFINSRFFSTASYKYSGTKLGSHLACNPKPGFTPYADIPPAWNPTRNFSGTHTKTMDIGNTYPNDLSTSLGEKEWAVTSNADGFPMGRYYSEAIDDNQQLVYLTFGVKKFNGLLDFLIGAIDYGDTIVANTGRAPTFYRAGRTLGTVLAFACFPITTTLVWVLKIATNLFATNTAFDYYYMVPTMHTYWAAVNSLVTQFATELKIINPAFNPVTKENIAEENDIGVTGHFDETEMEILSKMLGHGILDPKSGYVDIFAIMSRPQGMYRTFLQRRKEELDNSRYENDNGVNGVPLTDEDGGILGMAGGAREIGDSDHNNHDKQLGGGTAWHSAVTKYRGTRKFDRYLDNNIRSGGDGSGNGYWEKEDENTVASGEAGAEIGDLIASNEKYTDEKLRTAESDGFTYDFTGQLSKNSWLDKFKDGFDSAVHDGGDSAIFAVDFTGSMSDSVSNSTGDIETEGILKSVATGANNLKFNFSGGNLGVGIDLSAIGGAVKDFLKGGLDGVTMGFGNVLSTIFGDAYVDLPKRWSDSQVDISETSYTMKLRSPYGDPYSILQNQLIPLAMILAGSLPLSTGKSSYTSPFLCSLTCQGVQNIKLGMITSVNITRGTSNLPFTQSRRPLGIDVTFKVTDFSNLVTAPLNTSIFSKIFKPATDDTSALGRYIAVMSGRDIQTWKYRSLQVAQRLGAAKANLKALLSPNRLGTGLGMALNGPLSMFTAQGNFNPTAFREGRR